MCSADFLVTLVKLAVLVAVAVAFYPAAAGLPVAETKYGKVRGTQLTCRESTQTVLAFLGIPYARAPVGDLRLATPEHPQSWDDERDATKYGPRCPQLDAFFEARMHPFVMRGSDSSEDCLHLDVYTPALTGSRAVIVFIHGGEMQFGASSLADGTAFAAHEDVVFVAINYRLGALGFLYDGGGAWPSNLGLRDQQFALRWVRNNIAAFGGDPDRVTVAGADAGASCVSAHILTPSSRGIFHRAIVQSGSAFSVIRRMPPADVGRQFIVNLGCDGSDTEAMLSCVRGKTVDDILGAQLALGEHTGDLTVTFDDEFLPSDFRLAYSQGNFSEVDYLSGVTSNEGFIPASLLLPEMTSESMRYWKVQQQLRHFLGAMYRKNLDDIMDEVIRFYIGRDIASRGDDPQAYRFVRKRLAEIAGEMLMQAPTHQALQLHAGDVSNVFFYEMSHRPRFMRPFRPSWHHGCDHTHDVIFTLGYPLLSGVLDDDAEFTEEETDFSRMLLSYWGNFAKTGDPNGDKLVEWPTYRKDEESYLILQPKPIKSRRFKPDRMAFWNSRMRLLEARKPKHHPHEEL